MRETWRLGKILSIIGQGLEITNYYVANNYQA